jgi:hypothetical protein
MALLIQHIQIVAKIQVDVVNIVAPMELTTLNVNWQPQHELLQPLEELNRPQSPLTYPQLQLQQECKQQRQDFLAHRDQLIQDVHQIVLQIQTIPDVRRQREQQQQRNSSALPDQQILDVQNHSPILLQLELNL